MQLKLWGGIIVSSNQIFLELDARSENTALARVVTAAFIAPLDPTVEEVSEIKTAVSEAVTNAIIHGYEEQEGVVEIICKLFGNSIELEISDQGKGIEDIKKARELLYTSKPEMERSGMGFTIMESFMDEIQIQSELDKGTTIHMKKTFKESE